MPAAADLNISMPAGFIFWATVLQSFTDFDSDGYDEALSLLGGYNSGLFIHANNRDGTFTSRPESRRIDTEAGLSLQCTRAAVVGNFNNDDHLDVAVVMAGQLPIDGCNLPNRIIMLSRSVTETTMVLLEDSLAINCGRALL